VERKGTGHPDTICDAISEALSRAYAGYCHARFGSVAHHWFDKVMLIGGAAEVVYGVGEILKPMKIVCAGKCAFRVGDEAIPIEDLFRQAIESVLSKTLVGFRGREHYTLQIEVVDSQGAGRASSRYRPHGPEELFRIAATDGVSNDSNLLSGFAPFSRLERLVLLTERYVNGADFKQRHPDTGTDVKVFGRRVRDDVELLLNMPFLAGKIDSLDHYFTRKQEVGANVLAFCRDELGMVPRLSMNATDRNGRAYLTALGSVADTGDVGVTGRGNRINGLITPMRPMSIEAAPGKNPADHTGKLYGLLAQRLAETLAEELDGPCEVHIFTAKETPLNDPDLVQIAISENAPADVERRIRSVVEEKVAALPRLRAEIVFDGVQLW
jgi:S-adenosylmethionine synthetase